MVDQIKPVNTMQLTPQQKQRMVEIMQYIYQVLKEKQNIESPALSLYEWSWLMGLEEVFEDGDVSQPVK